MIFGYRFKNIESDPALIERLEVSLAKLQRVLQTFSPQETGKIVIEKHARRDEYFATITFHLPGQTIHTQDHGWTPEEALNNAADDAREEVLKAKDNEKNIHELRRKKG